MTAQHWPDTAPLVAPLLLLSSDKVRSGRGPIKKGGLIIALKWARSGPPTLGIMLSSAKFLVHSCMSDNESCSTCAGSTGAKHHPLFGTFPESQQPHLGTLTPIVTIGIKKHEVVGKLGSLWQLMLYIKAFLIRIRRLAPPYS